MADDEYDIIKEKKQQIKSELKKKHFSKYHSQSWELYVWLIWALISRRYERKYELFF